MSYSNDKKSCWLLWWCTYAGLHICARALYTWDAYVQLGQVVWGITPRGLVSDMAASAVLALAAIVLAQCHRAAPWLLVGITAAMLAGNRAYIAEWQDNLSWEDVGLLAEGDFLQGSVLVGSIIGTLVLLLVVSAGGYWYLRQRCVWKKSRWIYAFVALPIACVFWPAQPPQMWRLMHPAEESIRYRFQVGQLKKVPQSQRLKKKAAQWTRKFQHLDLSGTLQVAPRPGSNVLVIVVESLSQATMNRGWLPFLSEFAGEHAQWTQIINPNIVTARGVYSLMCGRPTPLQRYGRDLTALKIRKQGTTCLPGALRSHGYATAYLQAANLGFQNKLSMAKAMGFEKIAGNQELTAGQRFTRWGLDDPSLYAHAQSTIEQMESTHQGPWMMMVLTAGTHHPYNVAPEFMPDIHARKRAYLYADAALQHLMQWLEQTGRLAQTLVVVTGDESRDVRGGVSRLSRVLTRHHGALVIRTPDAWSVHTQTHYLQSDLPASILDYLGIHPPASMTGRSVFRQYERFRPVIFGDYAQDSVYAILRPGWLTACHTSTWHCHRHAIAEHSIFDTDFNQDEAQPVTEGFVRALVEQNNRGWRRP